MSEPAPEVPLIVEDDDSEPADEVEIPNDADATAAPPASGPAPEDTAPAATPPSAPMKTATESESDVKLGFLDYVPIFSILMVIGSPVGLVLFRGQNLSNKAQRVVNSPFIFGIVVMLHGVYGSKGITPPPKNLKALFDRPGAKIFTLLLLSFVATRDLEDSLFAAVLFLGLTQLFRTPVERRAHPSIL